MGNKSISANELSAVMLSKKGEEYDDAILNFDLKKITQLYKDWGFFSAEITPKVNVTEQFAELVFLIKEETRSKVRKVIIEENKDERIRKLANVHVNDFFIQEKIYITTKKIEDYYQNHGFPFASVSTLNVPDSGFLIFKIEKGTLSYIGTIEVKGTKVCNPTVIRREIELHTGNIFNKAKLYNSQRGIYALGFFSTVNVDVIKRMSDTVDLVFTIRELKSRVLNFGIGFSIPLSFLISLGFEELNLFNAGHRFSFGPSFKINTRGDWESKLEGTYTIPHLTPAQLTVSLFPFYWFENKLEFRRVTRGVELGISKIYSENIQFKIANQYKLVDFTPKITLPDTLKGHTNSMKFQAMIDYRDEFFNPKHGMYILPLIEYGGGIFGGDNNFLRFEIEERLFLPLFKNTIAQRLKLGIIKPTDGLALYEKYYLGGQYSLRGYPERSIGPDSIGKERYGNILINMNIEFRMLLPLNLGLVGFFDVGYIDNEIDLAQRNFLKASAGFGIRYNTIIGPLRADIGFPLEGKKSEIYFGLYHIF